MPGAGTSLTFDIFARDNASATFRRLGEQASGASDNVQHLSERLDKLGQRAVKARVGIEGDKEANAGIDKITARLVALNRQVANPDVTLEGGARMRAEISSLELALDKLGATTARPNVIQSKVAGLSFLQPSVLGAAMAMLPALIPVAGAAAAAVGAIGISFGAAGVAALGFGAMAAGVLTTASENAKKLSDLNTKLATATTAAQKKAIKLQIENLTIGWSKGYTALIGQLDDFKKKWQSVSQAVTVPALTAWVSALSRGLTFLKPALKPVADLFESLGISLNATLANNAPRVKELAAAFGRFAAAQLSDVARFVMDIAKGVFNLGKDLAGNGANFSAAGTWLARMGDGFLAWSKSASARRDVRGFMKFIHDEGPVVKGILRDLGTILPGIFVGATTIGTLELKALGDFLNLVANLPPGWQKPLTEFAGAMLLLSKIGVVKIGLQFTGALAALLFGGGGVAGTAGAAAASALGVSLGTALGAGIVAGVAAAGVAAKIKEDLKHDIPALGADLARIFSGLGGFFATGAAGLADMFVNHFRKPAVAGMHAAWHAVVASFHAFMGDMGSSFNAFRNQVTASFDADRRAIATVWDTIWRNTVTRTQHGINDAIHWFHTLPGRAIAALFGLGHRLAAFASAALNEMWNGIRRVGNNILGWFGRFVGKIVGFFAKLLHHSPTGEFYHMGKNMMEGLAMGLKDHAHLVGDAAMNAVAGMAGPGGGAPSANAALARKMMPSWGSGAEWAAWNYVAMRESGWNQYARNPSSGAYGIPQALPPGKMGAAANPPQSNPHAQISWMISYIRGRYGDPIGAAAHERAFNWYARGTRSALRGLAVVGERGPEIVRFRGGEQVYPAQAGGRRSGGAGVPVVLQFSSNGSEFDRFMTNWIQRSVRVKGGGDVQVAFGFKA